jgi:hypothetical protein
MAGDRGWMGKDAQMGWHFTRLEQREGTSRVAVWGKAQLQKEALILRSSGGSIPGMFRKQQRSSVAIQE